jgi:hypothetical protein
MPEQDKIRPTSKDAFSLERAKWLFNQRGFSYLEESDLVWEIPDLGTRPDFLLKVPGLGKVLVEVESFVERVEGFPFSKGFAQVSMHRPIRRMSTAIRHAARQLKPYAVLRIPLLVMLDNHRMCGIPSNIEFLRDAAFGEIQFRAPWDPVRSQLGNFYIHHHGPCRTLTETARTYITGVLWNLPKVEFAYDDSGHEVPMRVSGVCNHYAAVPFPSGLFTDSSDKLIGYDTQGHWKPFPTSNISQERHATLS